MSMLVKLGIAILVLGGAGAAAYNPVVEYWKERNRPQWKTAKVEEGDLVSEVTSTGTIKPVLSVSVGSFVSGPIVDLPADFNDEVKAGQILAKVDPRLFQANVDREEAILETREAEVDRVQAQLQQAINNENRGERLRAENEDFLSDTEMDTLTFNTQALRAQLRLAKASIKQAEASLKNARQNLDYTEIKSPVDGVVIDRKINEGQTLASSYQIAELFIVAPDLKKEVHVFASVDESEIGFIQKAEAEGRPVTFSVDAHPDEDFKGETTQIRLSSTTTQNVVTYPVVVSAPNPDLKLLPGMTALISFEVDTADDILKIPNAALRFYPLDTKHVREEDRKLLDGSSSSDDNDSLIQSATEKTESQRNRNRRHVWVVDGEFLRAVEVVTGLEDNKFSECVSGDLKEGDELVTGLKPKK